MPVLTQNYFHVLIRGIPPGNDKEDVEKHILESLGARSVVHDVVPDPESATLCTTVSFLVPANDNGDYIFSSLNYTKFRGLPQEIHLDRDFHGLTPLADEPGSTIDICFVHGLGGHAFRSWTGTQVAHRMWPRDFLPERFREERIKARFLTYGHRSNVFVHANPQATITTAAQKLLNDFIADRTKNPSRPVYFVCHSLGGLIVCEALINCLCTDQGYRLKDDYKQLFDSSGECLVKGVVFFGTPFQGASQANYIYPFIKALASQCLWPVNKSLVKSLKPKSVALNQIVPRFDRIRRDRNIRLLICHETNPIIGTSLTTNRESALGSFDRDVAPIEIDASHTDMIRFSHRGDRSYSTVESRITDMVRSQLDQPTDTVEDFDLVSRTGTDMSRPLSNHSWNESRLSQNMPQTPPLPAALPYRTTPTHPHRQSSSSIGNGYYDRPGSDSSHRQNARGFQRRSTENQYPTATVVEEPIVIDQLFGIDPRRFEPLRQYDTVFVIDDSGSMQKPTDSRDPNSPDRWTSMKQALEKFVTIAATFDEDGIDVYMLKHNKSKKGVKAVKDVLRIIRHTNISDPISGGGTRFKAQLELIIGARIDQLKKHRRNPLENQKPKPLNLIVVTDGEADDEEAVEAFLVETARELERLAVDMNFVGVQFVQVGDDVEASAYLCRLDDDLKHNYVNIHGQSIWDIVDTVRYKYEADDSAREVDFVKVLLGGIVERFDNQNEDSSTDSSDSD